MVNLMAMAASNTLLCIHRDPSQLSLLVENGYELITATNASDGLRLCMAQAVDAIVIEHQLSLLDGAVVAAEIKQIRPKVPIVMVADDMELPEGALKSVDAIVTKSDGPHFLWAAVHFVLNVKPNRDLIGDISPRHGRSPRLGRTRMRGSTRSAQTPIAAVPDKQSEHFSTAVWKQILNGTVQF